MSRRFLLPVALGLAILAVPAFAQTVTPPGPPSNKSIEPVQPPKDLPKPQRGDRVRGLDFLFEALKVAPDADSAKHIENRIWALWIASGSDTANLLMTRVKEAVDGKDIDLAIKLLDALIELRPEYVEAWNRRATLYYLKKDYVRAMADIRQVLAREPRHFGAISGLGMILQEFGDDKHALEAFRRAVAIHPHLQKIPEMIKTLSEKVEGRDI
ncbi:MAG: tetratricopeptide repeat protein [Pseudomonadota bacterium]